MSPFEFNQVFIGRDAERARVFVDASWDGRRLSFMGSVVPFGRYMADVAGQVVDNARQVNPELADLWDRWHLNDMRPGCEHQEHIMRLNPPARPTCLNDYVGSTGLALGSSCYECGYRYGSGWKYEEVPDSVLERISAILSDPLGC